MRKWIPLAWLLLMMPSQDIEMIVDQTTIIISTQTCFEGQLYYDDQLLLDIEPEDFVDGKVIVEDVQGGIYTLYVNQKMIDQIIINDGLFHIAFDQPVMQKIENQYLFQKQPQTMIVSPFEDPQYEAEYIEDSYFYHIDEQVFLFLDERYELFVDDSMPKVTFDLNNKIDEQTFITNQATITLIYEDTCPEIFKLYEEKEITIELVEGINDLSDYLYDAAGNYADDKLWIIYDSISPNLNVDSLMYISNPKTFFIDESYLDKEASYYVVDDEKKTFDSNQFVLDQTSHIEVYLSDIAGNISTYNFDVVYDDVAPMLHLNLEGGQLNLSYSEKLKSKSLTLTNSNTSDVIVEDGWNFEKEGSYVLMGELVDLAGNRTNVYELVEVDLNQPLLSIEMNQTVFLSPTKIEVTGSDAFNLIWEIEVIRNEEVIEIYQGMDNFHQQIFLSEDQYLDGQGHYRINVRASDGTYESIISKECLIDMRCAPLEMKINGYEAANVKELMMKQDVTFDVFCEEGDVLYKFYKIDGTMDSGQSGHFIISPNDQYQTLEFYSYDQHGYFSSKSIRLLYPVLTKKEVQVDEMEMVEEITQEIEEVETTIENNPITKTKESSYFWLGGVIIATIALRFGALRIIRFRNKQEDLSISQTVLFDDTKDTILLSDSKNTE